MLIHMTGQKYIAQPMPYQELRLRWIESKEGPRNLRWFNSHSVCQTKPKTIKLRTFV